MKSIFCFACFLLISLPAIAGERHVALIIGNANYQSTARFSKAVNDARAIASKLKTIGFAHVALKLDVSELALRQALAAFAERSRGADQAVVYFAGQGMNFGGENYLLPIDAEIGDAAHGNLKHAVKLEELEKAVGGTREVGLIILDVCREGILARMQTEELALNKTLLSTPCFSLVEPPAGIVIASAARQGSVAVDGDKALSPFARAILEHIGTPGMDIAQFFERVHDTVRFWTNQRQRTVLYGDVVARGKQIIPASRH